MTTVENILEQTRKRHRACIYSYVLMPEHVHFLINEPPVMPLDQFIKALKQETSKILKGDRKHFWQARYHDRNIRGEQERSDTIHYIHRNPVVRELAQSPEQYEYSSFNHYLTGIRGIVEIESEWTAARRHRAASETHSSR